MPVEQGRLRVFRMGMHWSVRIVLIHVISARSWISTCGGVVTATVRVKRLARNCQTLGACTTCTGAFGSGAPTGGKMDLIVVLRLIRRGLRQA